MILLSIGNPWDYLNGTSYAFGIDAGGANKAVGGVYNLFYVGVAGLTIVLIAAAIVGMIAASSPQAFSQGKETLKKRFLILLILGCASGFLTFVMTIFNNIFGIS